MRKNFKVAFDLDHYVCGHILAAKNYYDDECLIDKELRGYVLYMAKLPPPRYSYPIAYIISSDNSEQCGLIDLFKYCNDDIDDIDAIVEIPINMGSFYFPGTNTLRPFLWPCNIGDGEDSVSFLMGCSECMEASKLARQSMKSICDIRKR